MVGYPYPKFLNSFNDVDMASVRKSRPNWADGAAVCGCVAVWVSGSEDPVANGKYLNPMVGVSSSVRTDTGPVNELSADEWSAFLDTKARTCESRPHR